MARRRRPLHASRRNRRLNLAAVGAVGVLVLLVGLFTWLATRGDSATQITVGGEVIENPTEDKIRRAVEGQAARYGQTEVTITGGDTTISTTAAAVGLSVDVDTTVVDALAAEDDAVLPVALLVDAGASNDELAQFNTEAGFAEPTMALEGDTFVLVPGQTGARAIDEQIATKLADAAGASLGDGSEPTGSQVVAIVVELEVAQPTLTDDEVVELVDLANDVAADGIEVTVDDQVTFLSADELRAYLAIVDGELQLDPEALQERLVAAFTDIYYPGTDATFVVAFGQVGIEDGEPARECCSDDAGSVILAALIDGASAVDVPLGETPWPEGREWAEDLQIVELVGEFTTNHNCCESRVENIHRIAELTQGVIIEPGGTFSVNDFVGRRTTAKGFVAAGVIYQGVFTNDVGGGISQYATTLFNAAFFAGMEFGEYQSHSIYISRYPYGREATLSFPNPDLEIINPSPYGVLIWPTFTDSSITVQLFSTRWAEGEQTNQTTRQQGSACTRVVTERTRTFEDGTQEVDEVFAVYRPEGILCNGQPSVPTTTTEPLPTTTTAAPPPPTTTATTLPPSTTTTMTPTTTTVMPPPTTAGLPTTTLGE